MCAGFWAVCSFAGEDGVKKVKVLSGGEKVRCLLSKDDDQRVQTA